MSSLFDARVRYSGTSSGYQMRGVIATALVPVAATALVAKADGS